jgi:hypothetical protein
MAEGRLRHARGPGGGITVKNPVGGIQSGDKRILQRANVVITDEEETGSLLTTKKRIA